jgi:plasmid maintenance system antidote protein VapI
MRKRKTKPKTIQRQLSEAIQTASISQAELCRQTGIPPSNLSAFINGNRGLGLDSINQIGLVLELELKRKHD